MLDEGPQGGAVGPASLRGRPGQQRPPLRSGGRSSIVPTTVRTMWRRNLSAVISSSSASPRRCHAAARTTQVERLVPRLGRRERAEVVLAEQQIGRFGEPLLVERPRRPPRPSLLERRGRTPAPDPVPVAARLRGLTRVEVVGRLVDHDHSNVVGKRCIQRVRRPFRRRAAVCLDADDVAARVRPVSVRPATASLSNLGYTSRSASRKTPSTVRSSGCAAQPWKPVPSYSSVSFSRTSSNAPVPVVYFVQLHARDGHLRAALGIGESATVGDAVHADLGAAGSLDGVVDYLTPEFIGVRTDDGFFRFFGRNAFGGVVGMTPICSVTTSTRAGPKRPSRRGWARSTPSEGLAPGRAVPTCARRRPAARRRTARTAPPGPLGGRQGRAPSRPARCAPRRPSGSRRSPVEIAGNATRSQPCSSASSIARPLAGGQQLGLALPRRRATPGRPRG